MRRTIIIAAGALALAATPIAAQAQGAKPAATGSATGKAAANGEAPKMTPEQLADFQRGIKIIRLFTEAFTSDKVSTAVKGRLIACLYTNTLQKISQATGSVIKNSPTLDESKPEDIYRASAGVCGIVFKKSEAGEEATTSEGAKPAAGGGAAKPKTTGR